MWYGQKFEEVFFLMDGQVNLFTQERLQFMALPKQAVFGDYAILFNLKSNIVFKTGELHANKRKS